LTIDSRLIENSNLKIEGGNILSSTINPQNSTIHSPSSTGYDLTGKIASIEDRVKNLELGIMNHESSSSATIQSATPSASLAQQLLASASAQVAQTSSEVDKLGLTPPDILYATGSATLSNIKITSEATISGMLAANNLNVSSSFKSLGETILGKTSIAGDLSMDGTLSIEKGSEINVFGILFLQKSILAQGLDVFNGKVTVDKNGNITVLGEVKASAVSTNKLTILNQLIASSSATLSASIGTGKILAGQTSITIPTRQVSETAKIFVTPRSSTSGQALVVETVKAGESFNVTLDHSISADTTFDWWIVESK